MAVKISDGTPRLAGAIDDVFFRTWLATYPNREVGVTVRDVMEHFAKRESRLERRRSKLRSLPPNEGFFVAKEGNRVLGVCSVKKNDEMNELQAIYVLPERQGMGIGKLLWKRAVEFFDGKLPVVLQVAKLQRVRHFFLPTLGIFHTYGKIPRERFAHPQKGQGNSGGDDGDRSIGGFDSLKPLSIFLRDSFVILHKSSNIARA